MTITNTALAQVCVGLLLLIVFTALLLWICIDYQSNHGTMAAVLAANAGTALLASHVFSFHEFRHHTTGGLRYLTVFVGAFSGLLSAVFWIMAEVHNLYLPAILVLPFVLVLSVVFVFAKRVKKEGTDSAGTC